MLEAGSVAFTVVVSTPEAFTRVDSMVEAFTVVVSAAEAFTRTRVDIAVTIIIHTSATTTLLHGLRFMVPLSARHPVIMHTMAIRAPMVPMAVPIAHTSSPSML